MKIEAYVSEYLEVATEQFLHEIVNHGIYNTMADIISVETDEEYAALDAEFTSQAVAKLYE